MTCLISIGYSNNHISGQSRYIVGHFVQENIYTSVRIHEHKISALFKQCNNTEMYVTSRWNYLQQPLHMTLQIKKKIVIANNIEWLSLCLICVCRLNPSPLLPCLSFTGSQWLGKNCGGGGREEFWLPHCESAQKPWKYCVYCLKAGCILWLN